jgi:hypothetical protein
VTRLIFRERYSLTSEKPEYLLARLRLMYMSTVRLEAPRQVVLARRTSSLRLTGTPKSLFCRVEG